MKFAKFYVGVSASCVLSALALVHFANSSGTAQDGSKNVDARTDSALSVGTVTMWWGSRDAVPSGWEICDGQTPKTAGATLSVKKPDLTDRFPKGAQATRKNVKDLTQAVGGNHNMPALQIANIDGLKISEDGAHTHSPLERTPATDEVDQADNAESTEGTVVFSKGNSKKAKEMKDDDSEDDAPGSEGKHSHKVTGFIGTKDGIDADGNDKTGANQPAFAELFFIIRVK